MKQFCKQVSKKFENIFKSTEFWKIGIKKMLESDKNDGKVYNKTKEQVLKDSENSLIPVIF